MIVSVNSKPDLIEFKNLMLKTDRALNEDAKKRPKYYATRGGKICIGRVCYRNTI